MSQHSPQPSLHLAEVETKDRAAWLGRMEAAFAAGVLHAGLNRGDQPIPQAEEMAETLDEPGAEVLQILSDGATVGGTVVRAEKNGRRILELFFIDAGRHGVGIGAAAWRAIESRYPTTEVWETETPYFEQRNIHFYINTCGFHAVEFFHPGHRPEECGVGNHPGPDRMFRLEKRVVSRAS